MLMAVSCLSPVRTQILMSALIRVAMVSGTPAWRRSSMAVAPSSIKFCWWKRRAWDVRFKQIVRAKCDTKRESRLTWIIFRLQVQPDITGLYVRALSLQRTSSISNLRMRTMPVRSVQLVRQLNPDLCTNSVPACQEVTHYLSLLALICSAFKCSCTLIRHTRTHTQTLAQTHTLTLLCCCLQFYEAFGRLAQVITLVVSQSEPPSSSCFLFSCSSLTFPTLTLSSKSLVLPPIGSTLSWNVYMCVKQLQQWSAFSCYVSLYWDKRKYTDFFHK